MSEQWVFQPHTEQERQHMQQVAQGRSSAIRMMGLSRKPSGRIEQHLLKEGFDQTVIREILASLQADGYLDDVRLAVRLVQRRSGTQSESKTRLRQRLNQQGLDPDAVERALLDATTDSIAALSALTGKFKHATIDPSDRTTLARMHRFLASRGFSADVTRSAIREFLKGTPDLHDDDT